MIYNCTKKEEYKVKIDHIEKIYQGIIDGNLNRAKLRRVNEQLSKIDFKII